MTKKALKKSIVTKEKNANSIGEAHVGNGGEFHQVAGGNHPVLTTNQGIPVSDNQNSLRANVHGPTLLEDCVLREKITHFDHERIPERIVHARGTIRCCRADFSLMLIRSFHVWDRQILIKSRSTRPSAHLATSSEMGACF